MDNITEIGFQSSGVAAKNALGVFEVNDIWGAMIVEIETGTKRFLATAALIDVAPREVKKINRSLRRAIRYLNETADSMAGVCWVDPRGEVDE